MTHDTMQKREKCDTVLLLMALGGGEMTEQWQEHQVAINMGDVFGER